MSMFCVQCCIQDLVIPITADRCMTGNSKDDEWHSKPKDWIPVAKDLTEQDYQNLTVIIHVHCKTHMTTNFKVTLFTFV